MVKSLLSVVRSLRVAALELGGAALVVVGVAQHDMHHAAAFVVGGVALLGKSFELDLRRQSDPERTGR
ncbi:MAG TPA: hypothetical protein VHC63_13385 [Acidimicrobiales bacterium]|nr:hypothetical protein [Acidimicrobiales bacterium]